MPEENSNRNREVEPGTSVTVYERLKRSLLNNWAVATLVIAVVAGSAVLVFVQKAKEVVSDLRGQVTLAVTVDQGAECGPNLVSEDFELLKEQAVLDVGINNNSDENVMITAVRLIPIKVTGGFYAGELEPSGEYDVLVDDWYEMVTVAAGYTNAGEAGRAALVDSGTAWSENGRWWVKPSPLEVDAIPGAKYTIEANTAERLRIRMGLSRSIDFVIGEINLEIDTDRAGQLVSGPHEIAICVPSGPDKAGK